MPWDHCHLEDIRDDSRCPACGETKPDWSVLFDNTRRLVIGKPWLEVDLVDERDLPVPHEPLRVEDPAGRQPAIERRLDAHGHASLEPPRGCKQVNVVFPRRDPRWFEPAWLDIELVDDQGQPVAGEPFRVLVDGKELHCGELDGQGRAHVEGLPHRPVVVEFSFHDAAWWAPVGAPPPPQAPPPAPEEPVERPTSAPVPAET